MMGRRTWVTVFIAQLFFAAIAGATSLENGRVHPYCFKDRFNKENIHLEIEKLELEHPGAREKYLKLSYLFYPASLHFKNDEVSLLYLWYLKMGNVISSSSTLLGYPSIHEPLDQFLFDSDQLRLMIESVYRISPLYQDLWTMQRIQKIPSGYPLDAGRPTEAGLSFLPTFKSSPTHSVLAEQGWINLAADFIPLERPEHSGGLGGKSWGAAARSADLADILIHELSHHVDFTIDNPFHEDTLRLSSSPEWLKLSGWQSRKTGSTVQWTHTAQSDEFVTSYARSNPREDFAESAARFVTDPEKMKRLSKKNEFISDWLYRGRAFDSASRLSAYADRLKDNVLTLLPDQLAKCQDSASQQNCLLAAWKRAFEGFVQNTQEQDFGACVDLNSAQLEILEKGARIFREGILGHLPDFSSVTANEVSQLVTQWKQWIARFSPRETFMNCYSSPSPESCYSSEWIKHLALFESSRKNLRVLDLLNDLKTNASLPLSYGAARVQAINFIGTLVVEHDGLFIEEMRQVWNSCLNATEGSESVDDSILMQLDSYVRTGILKCIATQLPEQTRVFLNSVISIQLPQTKSALLFASTRLMLRDEQVFNNFADLSSDLEDQAWKQFFQENRRKMPSPQSKNRNCVSRHQKILNESYDKIIEGVPSLPSLNFTTRDELLQNWAEMLCK